MSEREKGSWFDSVVAYAPILALLLVMVSIASKAPKMENPYTWVVGLTTLPAVFAILYSALLVYRQRGKGSDKG